jgi:hypothetical protein
VGWTADILDASCGILIAPRDPASLMADLEQAIVILERSRSLREHGSRGMDESSSRVHLACED